MNRLPLGLRTSALAALAVLGLFLGSRIHRLSPVSPPAPGLSPPAGRSRQPMLPPGPRLPAAPAASQFEKAVTPAATAVLEKLAPSGLAEAMNDPDFMRAFRYQVAKWQLPLYARLFRQLHLSDAELDSLQQQLASKYINTVGDAMSTLGRTDSILGYAQGIEDVRNSSDTAIESLLGRDRYAVYRAYEQSLPYQNQVTKLQAQLQYSQEPLSDEAAGSLAAQLNAAEQSGQTRADRMQSSISAYGEQYAAPIKSGDLAVAAGVLSPGQLSAYREMAGAVDPAAALGDVSWKKIGRSIRGH